MPAVTAQRSLLCSKRWGDPAGRDWPAARHVLEQYANNRVEADHGRLKARLGPMRGVKTIRSLRTVAAGHAFMQNLRRGHYAFTTDVPSLDRVRVAFTELAPCL